MSHFSILIIGNSPDEQLKPFDENLDIDFNDCTEEAKKSWEEKTINDWYVDVEATVTKEDYDNLEKDGKLDLTDFPSDPFQDYKFKDGAKIKINYEFPENIWKDTEHPRFSEYAYALLSNVKKEESHPVKILFTTLVKIDPPKKVSVQTKYTSFENFLNEYHGYKTQEDGSIGYWRNNKAKWDWYELGGRWTGMLKLKPETDGKIGKPGLMTDPAKSGFADSAKKCDIDFIGMKEVCEKENSDTYDKFLLRYENNKECKGFRPEFEFGIKGKMEEGIFIPETKEDFIKRLSGFVTFAILKDGEWYERGEMGCWGIASNEKPEDVWDQEFTKMINELPEETVLSVYDCHI